MEIKHDSRPTTTAPLRTYKRKGKIVYQEDYQGYVVINENPCSNLIRFDECETPIYRIVK